MTKNQSLYILPKLHDFGGDLSQQWYIEYSVYDATLGKKKRMRYSVGINCLIDVDSRMTYCTKVMNELAHKLQTRSFPCMNTTVTYEDTLLYNSSAKLFGSERKSNVTIRTYLSEFLKRKEIEIIHHSFKTYQSKLRIFCQWCEYSNLIRIHVSQITNDNICDFFRFIYEKKKVSRRTILKYKQILFNFFEYLKDTKSVIEKNPVYNIPRIGTVVDEAPVPIPEKTRKVLQEYMESQDPQLWLVCLMQFYCAIRPGEELRLMKIGDINFESHTIIIRSEIAKNRQKESIDIPNQLYSAMINIYHLNEYQDTYYIFSKDGQPGIDHLGKNTFRFRFDKIRDELGLSKCYKLYSFKHSGAVALINSGFNTQELQRHFRHKSIVTTERYFRKNIGEHNEKMINDFPDI